MNPFKDEKAFFGAIQFSLALCFAGLLIDTPLSNRYALYLAGSCVAFLTLFVVTTSISKILKK